MKPALVLSFLQDCLKNLIEMFKQKYYSRISNILTKLQKSPKSYGVTFRQKIITFMPLITFLYFMRHTKLFKLIQHIFITGTVFCDHVFLFFAKLPSQHESLFWVSYKFFCCRNIFFCDSHNFGAQCNFYVVKYFFVEQHSFLCNT